MKTPIPATLTDVTDYIRDQATGDDLLVIRHLANLRKTLLRTVNGSHLRPGTPVTTQNMRRAYFNGLTGTIASLDTSRSGEVFANLALDRESAERLRKASRGRHHDAIEGIPLSGLTAA